MAQDAAGSIRLLHESQGLVGGNGAMCAILQGKVDMKVIQTSIMPVALCFAISLVFANKTYIYLSVSYIQVSVGMGRMEQR